MSQMPKSGLYAPSNPFSNGNNLINLGNHNDNGLPRVIHHEHSDSGLGGEQDDR